MNGSAHRMGAVEGWVVTHDGETIKSGFKNDFDAVNWLHKRHSYSVDHAVRHEGYDIVLVKNGKVAYSYKREALKRPNMGDLRDVPLPPNVERPEMWTPEAIVMAVRDGFTFGIPFISKGSLFTPNAYWIAGRQVSASLITVGPEHTPEIGIVEEPEPWIRVKTFFPPEMVPEQAWLAQPNAGGVVPVYVEIDPDTIDWEWLNRGHQIRVRRG